MSKGLVRIGEVAGTSFDDTTAVAGTTYWYFVRAKNAVSTSAYSTGNSGFRSTVVAARSSSSTSGSSLMSSLFSSSPIVLDDIATR